MNWREILISPQRNCKGLILKDMITGTVLVFINRIAGLSFDLTLLKYCSHTSCCSGDDMYFLPLVLQASLVQGMCWLQQEMLL